MTDRFNEELGTRSQNDEMLSKRFDSAMNHRAFFSCKIFAFFASQGREETSFEAVNSSLAMMAWKKITYII